MHGLNRLITDLVELTWPAARWASLSLAFGCFASHSPGQQGLGKVPGFATDTALFATVVRSLPNAAEGPIRVDPRPLRASRYVFTPGALGAVFSKKEANQKPLADVSDALLEGRRHVLRRLSVRETNAVSDDQCPGNLILPEIPVDRSKCPRDGPFRSVAVALPRSSEDSLTNPGRISQAPVIIRVSIRSMTAHGGSTNVSDYYVERASAEKWAVKKVVFVRMIE